MKRLTSPSILVQVALLVALAMGLSQALTAAAILLMPEPRPSGFDLAAASAALRGEPARTADDRPLTRRITDQPVATGNTVGDPMALALSLALARVLEVEPGDVRVRVFQPTDRPIPGMSEGSPASYVFTRSPSGSDVAINAPSITWTEKHTIERADAPESASPATGSATITVDRDTRQVFVVADQLTFAPFAASLRLEDGRWATVEPPRDWLSPWQARLLLALFISLLLVAPVVWLMARRLTRPIRLFADAAQRLGANPEAEPLPVSGPSELRRAIGAFNDMQASLRAHIANRTQTVAAIAHDLRTPLTRLRFRAEQAPEALRDRLAADVEEMDALIAQAMAYVRGETRQTAPEPVDLTALVTECVRGFAETGHAATLAPAPEVTILGQPTGLRRALTNLIANAVHYGGRAEVSLEEAPDRVAIYVRDGGPGIAPERMEEVFQPFVRLEGSRNRATGGVGLGLAVARQIARAHDGDVTLSNRPEGGLEATLSLPRGG
ncbi:MAG: HAMP domain-containing protein [Alphaproteobacteria bacterium]|nr:HAMP domain-containing protein [Alphaproteobacteria bacterium]